MGIFSEHHNKHTDTTTKKGAKDHSCACGCCGNVPEYEEDDFIVEEDEKY